LKYFDGFSHILLKVFVVKSYGNHKFMPEIININVEINLESEKILRVQERIRVPKNSSVIWNVKFSWNFFEELYFSPKWRLRKGLIFTVYFSQETPFEWKRESLRLPSFRPLPPFPPIFRLFRLETEEISIAEGVAEKEGEFKYGIKVSEVGNDEPIYDEDPYLIVF